MTVFIVTTSHGIQAVFDSHEQAALYCAIRKGRSEMRIEEHVIDPVHMTANLPLRRCWIVCVTADRLGVTVTENYYTFEIESGVFEDIDSSWIVTLTTNVDATEEQVKRSALERIEEYQNGLQRS